MSLIGSKHQASGYKPETSPDEMSTVSKLSLLKAMGERDGNLRFRVLPERCGEFGLGPLTAAGRMHGCFFSQPEAER